MLEALEHLNLFVIPLDNERRWYRYHHLFADVLNRRLEHLFPQQLADLHRRASHWYEQNGFIAEATQHALLIGDQDRAIQTDPAKRLFAPDTWGSEHAPKVAGSD